MRKAKFTPCFLMCLFVAAMSSCQQGQRCQELLVQMGKDAEALFEEADSVRFVSRIQSGKALLECIEQSSDVTESEKGSATLLYRTIQEKKVQLPCRCYQRELARVFMEMGDGKDLKTEDWTSLYTRWNDVASASSLTLNDLRESCLQDDLESVASMKSQVEMWNGYHMADDAMDEIQVELDKALSRAKGIWEGIEDAIEEAIEDAAE